jgi:hypothetical protein
LELSELEEILAKAGDEYIWPLFDPLLERLVDWHGTPDSICLIKGKIRLVHEAKCSCGEVGSTVFLGQGLHAGAWVYAYDEEGNFLANLRDQEYVCPTCEQRKVVAEV